MEEIIMNKKKQTKQLPIDEGKPEIKQILSKIKGQKPKMISAKSKTKLQTEEGIHAKYFAFSYSEIFFNFS